MRNNVVIWGASGHAKVVAEIIDLNNEFEIVGFLDDINVSLKNTEFCGSKILGGREQLDILIRNNVSKLIFGFGDCAARLALTDLVLSKGFSLITVIHPRSIISKNVSIGSGTVIAAGAIITPGCNIGSNVIVNTAATIDHDCIIEDGVHICPGVNMAGNVRIGRGAWIGIGSIIRENVTIGENSVIGAGSVVIQDISSNEVVYGNPAQKIRKTS
jgi:acetyltransferase EpsM